MIPVTKPFLPPKETFDKLTDDIWSRNWLTNNGPLVNELELNLKEELGVAHILFVTNGTIAIQLAIRALELRGEIITTPFSYVATTSSLVWEDCRPVYVDIDPRSLNIDPTLIEAAITSETSAILATHCFGNPCDITAIQKIAAKHNLKVIYDAAHCFGVTYKGRNILNYGDISSISFHATKLFHTVEGGAVTTNDAELLKSMANMRNFGHKSHEEFHGLGINGKNSEFHAAMGLSILPYMNSIIEKRKKLCDRYVLWQEEANFNIPLLTEGATPNYSYFPVIFPSEGLTLKVFEALRSNDVYARKYFYPTLNKLPYVQNRKCKNAEDISKRILCLPLYNDLTESEVDMICRLIIRTIKYS